MERHPERTEWILDEPTSKLHTFTIVFQTFVFMQLFNMINSRTFDHCNVFESFFTSCFFPAFMIIVFAFQMLLVSFGGRLIRVYPLPIKDSAICLAFAASGLVWGLLFRAIPSTCFDCLVRKEKKLSSSSSIVSMQWMRSYDLKHISYFKHTHNKYFFLL